MASSRPPRRRADRGPRRDRVRTKPTLSRPRSRDPDGSAGDVVKATSPADVLGILPFVLGFHPAESLVVVALDGPRSRIGLTIRVDLPPVGDPVDDVAADVVGALTRNRVREVLLVAYAIRAECSGPLVGATLRALAQQSVVVRDAWRADGSRWFSLLCSDPDCCPPSGSAYDPSTSATAAQAIFRGEVAAPDREALRAAIEPPASSRAATEQATDRALRELVTALGRRPPGREWARLGMPWIAGTVMGFVGSPRLLTDDECARISVWILSTCVRDVAWSMIRSHDIDAHVDLWTQVTRRAAPGHVAAPASLLGFACWLRGDGALARLAVDRALSDDPDYSMAQLIEHTLDLALPPTTWSPFPLETLFAASGLPCPPTRQPSE
jgi:Domain of unknown function (DUF4192)